MPERSSTPNLADMQRQWQEMAEAAARPWQEVAEVFAEPWRDLAESITSNSDFEKVGQQAWDIFTSSVTAFAEQQQHIAEAIFDAMRTGAEELQKAMEPLVDQMTSFGQRVVGGGSGGAARSASNAGTATAASAEPTAAVPSDPAAKAARSTAKAT